MRISLIQAATIFQIILMVSLFLIANCSTHKTDFRIGVARVNMTPPVHQRPVALGGYGERDGRPATGVRDSVYARAMVIESGGKKCCLVSLDLCFTPASIKEETVKILNEHDAQNKSGLSMTNILLSATHSHAAPEAFAMSRANIFGNPRLGIFDEPLLLETAAAAAKAILDANANLTPARIGIGSAQIAGMSRNRRGNKIIDPELTVIKVIGENEQIKAVWMNFTAHPTILDADFMEVSGGWPGVLATTLEQDLGNNAVVLFTNGAQGDQSAVAKSAPSDYERVLNYSSEMKSKVAQVLETINANQQPEIGMVTIDYQLPEIKISPTFELTAGHEYNVPTENLLPMINQLFPQSVPLAAIHLGNLVMVSVPGEMICEIGLDIKKKLRQNGIEHPVIVGLANKYIGYILTQEEYHKGGYEAAVSFYGETLGAEIEKGIIDAGMQATSKTDARL
ncbi:neutral/alkaline non-lysosomal ceramidase N-terminal domain-containing protein [candidate division KSB1 bacterium]|nr:neutral/alkaline non-lysosomal ceramidase N-terminal domain-containing protein [candidate division KSB1 bacterium]